MANDHGREAKMSMYTGSPVEFACIAPDFEHRSTGQVGLRIHKIKVAIAVSRHPKNRPTTKHQKRDTLP